MQPHRKLTTALAQGVAVNTALLGSWLGALRAYARWAEHHKHPAA